MGYSQVNRDTPLSPDPFARETRSFSELLEPDGYVEFMRTRGRTYTQAKRLIPLTSQASWEMQNTFSSWDWGYQYSNRKGQCDWTRSQVGVLQKRFSRNPNEQSMQYGLPLREQDLVRHLTGQNRTLGTCDRPLDIWFQPDGISLVAQALSKNEAISYSDAEWCYFSEQYVRIIESSPLSSTWQKVHGQPRKSVRMLRFDIDCDDVWQNHDLAALVHQIQIERKIASELGLEYRIFRTGGRGHQALFLMPVEINLASARWLSQAIRQILTIRSHSQATDFKSNFDGLLRLPFGIHHKRNSFGLGLFLKPDTGEILPLDDQLEQLRSSDKILNGAFESIDWNRIASTVSDDGLNLKMTMPNSLDILGDIPLIAQIRDSISTTPHQIVKPEPDYHRTQDRGHEWAAALLSKGYNEGESYDFHVKRGGIRAAFLVHGTRAEKVLHELAKSVPSSRGQMQDRTNLITSLCRTHYYLPPSPYCSKELSPDAKAVLTLLETRMITLGIRNDALSRNLTTLDCIITLLDAAEWGQIEVTASYVREWALRKTSTKVLSERSYSRALNSLTEKHSDCVLPVLSRIRIGRKFYESSTSSKYYPSEWLTSVLLEHKHNIADTLGN